MKTDLIAKFIAHELPADFVTDLADDHQAIADAAADSDGKKKAKAKARAKFGELDTLNVAIGKEVAKQQSGGKAVGTTSRGVLRDAPAGDLREWNRTAEVAVGKGGGLAMGEHAAVAEDLKRPEIMDGFRMPHGNNDTELAGRARAFNKAVGDLALHDDFVEHGLEDDFEDSNDTQSAAAQETTGAADALGELITTGMGIRKSLDALVNNLFKGNATVIGEWATASHVERQGSRKVKPTPATTTPASKP